MKFKVHVNYDPLCFIETIELPFIPSIGMTIAYSIQKELGVERRVVKIAAVEFDTSNGEFFVEVDKTFNV